MARGVRMILLINICREELHTLEFVKPLEDILKKLGKDTVVRDYVTLTKKDLEICEKIIICGTSLKDNEFSKKENLKYFSWIKNFDKPLLGICGGMQVIGSIFGGQLKKKKEIGFFEELFVQDFLGLAGKQQVYHLHNNFVDFKKLKMFEVYSENDKFVQAIKHKERKIYGVLFHPEVRQKKMIEEFGNV